MHPQFHMAYVLDDVVALHCLSNSSNLDIKKHLPRK